MKDSMSFWGVISLALLLVFSSCEKTAEITEQELIQNNDEVEFIYSDEDVYMSEAELKRLLEDNTSNERSCCSGISSLKVQWSGSDSQLNVKFEQSDEYLQIRHYVKQQGSQYYYLEREDRVYASFTNCTSRGLNIGTNPIPSGNVWSIANLVKNNGPCGSVRSLNWTK